jgi:hypothetical protein
MLTCPYCGSETSSEYNLCENCLQQVKCANQQCGAALRPNKSKCLMCGTPTLESQQTDPSMNRYVRNVQSTSKSYSEHIEIVASDTAIGNFGPLMLGNGQPHPHPPSRVPIVRTLTLPAEPNTDTDASLGESTDTSPSAPSPSSHSKHDENQVTALEFFENSSDELTPLVADFKGLLRKDQLIRFLIIYVWAYQHVFGKPAPSDEHLVAATKRTALFDGNYRNYFGPTSRLYYNGPKKLDNEML